MAFGAKLVTLFDAIGMPLHEATYINDWVDPHPLGPGLYWGIKFKDGNGNPWKLDIWGWDPFDYAVRQARDYHAQDRPQRLRPRPDPAAQDRSPRRATNYYGVRVTSFDIYQFAIAKAGDSLSALEKWKMKQ